MECCTGKEGCELTSAEELYTGDSLLRIFPVSGSWGPAEGEMSQEEDLKIQRKKVKEWEQKVRFDRKVPVRSLYEVAPSDPSDFVGHFLPVLWAADVLDDRVRKDHIEGIVFEMVKITGISRHGLDI